MENTVALGYTRLSQESDTSIDDQRSEIRQLADEEGFDLVKIYNDGERSSGFDADRPEYQKLLAHIDEDDIDVIVVRDADRLARDKKERITLMFDLEEYGVELWTTATGEPIDIDDDESFLIEMLQAYFDDVVKQREIEKSKRKIQQRIDNGYYHGRPPYGFKFRDDKTGLEPDPDEFEDAYAILRLRKQGLSYREIASKTDVSRSTVGRVISQRDRYEEHAGILLEPQSNPPET